jgi:two-component system nitrogen regulation response regulator GlnG
MKVLGVMLDKKTEQELEKGFREKINFIDSYTDLFEDIKKNKHDAVVMDADGAPFQKLLELIERIVNFQKKTIIIILGEKINLNFVAGCIKAGAYDYMPKPAEAEKIYSNIQQVMKNRRARAERLDKNQFVEAESVIGNTKQMLEIYKMIGKVAASHVSLFMSGESGTGKQLIAKAIHNLSNDSDMAFVPVNCMMLKEDVFEKRFFGVEKEEIDGSINIQPGYLEQADNGTLFLKEVSELGMNMQAKLLEVLQEGEYTRVGGTRVRKTNARIIASSGVNLEDLIYEGKFREDLYHKLKVVEMTVPSLRERKDDIPLIVNYCVKINNEVLGYNIKGVSKAAMEKILKYDWPGNIRELRNTIKSSMELCRGNSILVEDLPASVKGTKSSRREGDLQDWVLADWVESELEILKAGDEKSYFEKVVSRVERELIKQVLELNNGKKVDTAEILGITRNTLRSKMNNYGLE